MADTDLPEADFYRVIQATTGLKLKEIREIQDVFDYFDTDHDGSLTKEQAVMAWKTFGILVKESDMVALEMYGRSYLYRLSGNITRKTSSGNGLLSEYFQQCFT